VVLDLQGRCDEAIRAFRRAIQLAPRDPVARLNLGALYGELRRYEDAARELDRCRRLAPGFDASFNLALVRYRQGEHAVAADLFAEALRYDRTHALGHYYRGLCHFKLGRTEDAVNDLLTALRHQPDLVHARYRLGMAWNKMGRYRMAVQELEQVARVLADDGRVHYQLGIAYDGLAMKTEARESYRRARTLAG
jgi:Flp pilus assembly protein TadD